MTPLTTNERINHIWSEIASESSHRSLVILSASLVEELLEGCIRLRLKPDLADSILNPRAPVGAFSAKITLALAMGVIGENFASDLANLNDIRNRFAHDAIVVDNHHKASRLTLESAQIRDRCAKFRLAQATRALDVPKWTETKDMFLEIVANMVAAMFSEMRDCEFTVHPTRWLS